MVTDGELAVPYGTCALDHWPLSSVGHGPVSGGTISDLTPTLPNWSWNTCSAPPLIIALKIDDINNNNNNDKTLDQRHFIIVYIKRPLRPTVLSDIIEINVFGSKIRPVYFFFFFYLHTTTGYKYICILW